MKLGLLSERAHVCTHDRTCAPQLASGMDMITMDAASYPDHDNGLGTSRGLMTRLSRETLRCRAIMHESSPPPVEGGSRDSDRRAADDQPSLSAREATS